MTLVEELNNIMGQENVCEKEPMKNHTTFRIGGPAQMTGESPERFFNLCAASGLDIWDVIFSKGNYIFSMGIHDFFST